MHIHWLRLFVVFQEIQCLLNFHYDVFRQGIESYHVSSFVFHIVFLCQLHTHTYAIKNVLAKIFCVVFQEIQCLHNFNHDNVRHVTELYLSTKFHVCQCCS